MKRATITIIVVDDYKPWRDFICSLIEEAHGIHVVAKVSGGLEAVQKARELQPDLILLDIALPKLNGLEVLQIRQCAPKSRILSVSVERSGDMADAVNGFRRSGIHR